MYGTLQVYIFEDNFAFRKQIHEIIKLLSSSYNYFSIEVIEMEESDFSISALDSLVINDNDIFLVDIDLNTYYSGIDLAKAIRHKNAECFILFLTNLENKALEVINQGIYAKSYMIKNTSLDFDTFEGVFRSIEEDILKRMQNPNHYISLKKFGELLFLNYEDILYFTSMSGIRNTLVVRTTLSEHIVQGSINKLKKEIEVPYFSTELKSYLINLNRIKLLNRSASLILFDNDSELEVGFAIIDKLNKTLKNRISGGK
ncbi:hypothetical protein UAW_01772 [Enterococcus haemoperoxidus ATCC BAA-382]|uniref:HTH LytTR-type domain-containing protein n=1 Tax=Enterococcus haemoperoxidus ATCC BAA-382 TaxID=1158608 RepID=R2T990_9ENTE|nr:LytTR family transcriptional regulator DNA-binding domain-containing protein [Enterococcus haemoperoxidus]EOH96814.1 hypothetical protein UAW_01772 [Enterococcus haemoperoxidus ATCC BAA-382]EOT60103.1 hypothetical protein I583_02738 [Enterococcus haemoperoxidus ATCC BAA-382]OJG51769.1 hypothetical protein RV06_GL001525 [Enterococcus haemoperoxidus]